MAIPIKESLEILLGFCAVGGIIYRIGKVEAAIYQAMDKIEDGLREELRQLQRDFSVHLANYAARKEWQDSVAHQLNEKIDHKFKRLHDEQKDMQRYLEKSGFKIRQYPRDEEQS